MRFKDGREIRRINPSQTLMKLQYIVTLQLYKSHVTAFIPDRFQRTFPLYSCRQAALQNRQGRRHRGNESTRQQKLSVPGWFACGALDHIIHVHTVIKAKVVLIRR